jgi:uroporphyrinogen-III synthase
MPTVLITRPKADAAEFADALARHGLRTEFFPTIEIAPITDWTLPTLEDYNGLVFTSANAVRYFISPLLSRAPNRFARLRAMNHYAVGIKTHRTLQEYGIDSALYSDKGNAEDLVDLMRREGIQGKRFLFLRGTRSLGVIPDAIKKHGGMCDELIVYQTSDLAPEDAKRLSDVLSCDVVTWVAFFSPSAVRAFFNALPNVSLPLRLHIAVIGNTTKEAVEALGFRVDVVSPVPTAEALAQAIANFTSP